MREIQNGIKKPLGTGVCAQIWALCDAEYAGSGEPPTAKAMVDLYGDQLNAVNIKIQVSAWRKYYGMPIRNKSAKPRSTRPTLNDLIVEMQVLRNEVQALREALNAK